MRQPRAQRLQKRTALVLITILLLGLLPLPGAEAATATVMGATLPSPQDQASAVGTDDGIYLFGGRGDAPSLQILHYDPVADQLSATGAALPSGRYGTSAVWDGQYAYVLGGGTATYLDQIVRFDPATNTVQAMGGKLPSARTYTSSVWTGQYVFVFGGATDASTSTDQIVRYDPVTDTVTAMAETLPTGLYGTSAVWDGQYAYIFGGFALSSNTRSDDIVRYDPATGAVTVLGASLPSARYHTAAVVRDGVAQVFGGYGCGGTFCAEIVDVDLATETVTANTTTLPTGRLAPAAALFGRQAYLLGGSDSSGRLDQIVRHGPLGPNTAPVLDAIADATVQATAALGLAFSAADADHEPLAFTATGVPAGASFTDNGDGTAALEWTPTRDDEGNHTITIDVTDGTDTVGQSFVITVTEGPDRAPVFTAIADRNLTAGSALNLTVEATDADGDPITLTLTSAPTAVQFVDNGDGTASLGWTTTPSDEGVHEIVITASAAGVNVTESFLVNVTVRPNTAPILGAVDDASIVVGQALNITLTATDAEGDDLTLDLSPALGDFQDHANGTATFVWTPTAGDIGTHTFTFSATDGGLTNSTTFTVQVRSATEPVLEAIADQSTSEGQLLAVAFRATDPQGLNLTLALEPQPLPIGATFADHGDGNATLTWDVPHSAAGAYFFTVTASNGNEAASDSFQVVVADVPAPPQFISSFDEATFALGETGLLSFSAEDPDGTPVSLSATGLPAGATFTDGGAGSGTLQWPNAGPAGTYTVDVHATSDGQTTTATQRIVIVTPFAFTLAPVPSPFYQASPGELAELQLRVTNTGAMGDTYTFTAFDSGPHGLNVTAPTDLFVPAGTSAIATFTVNVTDDVGLALPRIFVTSSGDDSLTRQLSFQVTVPVVMEIVVVEPSPVGFSGVVRFTWADGSVADNVSFTARHTWLGQSATAETLSGTSGDDGTWAFDAQTSPRFVLPGGHTLSVTASHGGRSSTTQVVWNVLV